MQRLVALHFYCYYLGIASLCVHRNLENTVAFFSVGLADSDATRRWTNCVATSRPRLSSHSSEGVKPTNPPPLFNNSMETPVSPYGVAVNIKTGGLAIMNTPCDVGSHSVR